MDLQPVADIAGHLYGHGGLEQRELLPDKGDVSLHAVAVDAGVIPPHL